MNENNAKQTENSVENSDDNIFWYKKQIKHLKGKIQGYQTLSSLLHESKREIKLLKQRNGELGDRLGELLTATSLSQSALSSSFHIPSAAEPVSVLPYESREALELERTSGHFSVASKDSELGDMEFVNRDAVVTAPMPDDMRVASAVPESLEIDPYDLHIVETANVQNPFSLQHLTCGKSSNQNPTADHSQRASSASSNGDTSSSVVLIFPDDLSNLAPPLIPTPGPPGEGPGPLVNQVAYISEVLTRYAGLSSPSELSDAMAKLAIDVLKIEKELRMKQKKDEERRKKVEGRRKKQNLGHKKPCFEDSPRIFSFGYSEDETLINNLCPENEALKAKLEATIQAREESIRHLRREKAELQRKLAEVTTPHNSPQMAVSSPEWVHVEDPKDSLTEKLEQRMHNLESLHNTEVQKLQEHLEAMRTKLRQCEAAASRSQEDSQRLLTMAKTHTQEEAKSKDIAISHFHSEQERRHECEAQLLAERRRAVGLADQVVAMETQLALFQDDQATRNLSPEESMHSLAALNPQELRTKIHLLQQQVLIYKEDFDRERQDRERIQADKDAIENVLRRYKADLIVNERRVREFEQECKVLKAENTCLRQEFQQIRQCEQDVVRLQSENIRFREQLQQKIDEIRRMTATTAFTRDKSATSVAVETWQCSACTFENPGVRSSCEVCGRTRSRSSYHPTPPQAPRLLPHSGGKPMFGWTECDTKTPSRLTRGDDLIIDDGEDVPDKGSERS